MTTAKIVRKFSTDPELYKKLVAYRGHSNDFAGRVNSGDFSAYMDTMGKLN